MVRGRLLAWDRLTAGMGTSHDFELHTDAEGVVWLAGERDMSNAERGRRQTTGNLDGQAAAVLDLSDLQFLDSTGIRAFLQLANDRTEGVVLRNPRPNVRRVLEIAGVGETLGVRVSPLT